MTAGAEHVDFQLPNEHTRVGYLLEAIESSDATLQAALAAVRSDDGPNGLQNDFEQAVAKLLSADSVARRQASGKKQGAAAISGTHADTNDNTPHKSKSSIGKTGYTSAITPMLNFANLHLNKCKSSLNGEDPILRLSSGKRAQVQEA